MNSSIYVLCINPAAHLLLRKPDVPPISSAYARATAHLSPDPLCWVEQVVRSPLWLHWAYGKGCDG